MTKMVNLTINGQQVSVPDGTLLVNAAKQAGIDIPVFCYHPKMEPVGMCRMCLVEIGRPMIDRTSGQPVLDENGSPKIQFGPKLETACTTPVSESMLVLTASEKAKSSQKEVVELLLTSHPLDCPVCDKGGECPLQNLTMAYGSGPFPLRRKTTRRQTRSARRIDLPRPRALYPVCALRPLPE
jgi:NADH-quinone oxidoreductase subunit G